MSTETKTRIHWNYYQKKQILEEAGKLAVKNPHWNNLKLIREAQKVLENQYRRNLSMVSWQQSFRWFVEGVDPAIERAKKEEAESLKIVETENNVAPEVEGKSEDLPVNLITILSTLVKVLEDLQQGRPEESIPVGIVGRLERIQSQVDQIEKRVNDFFSHGLTFTVMPAGSKIVPAIQNSSAGLQVQSELPEQEKVQSPPTPVTAEIKTRKPRVIVLNTDSGHVRHGIIKGSEGYVNKISFADVSGVKTPNFNEFDYILAYKKTPITWIEVAKKFYDRNKFYCVSGGAINVVERIKSIPPIEVKDE